MAGVLEGVEVLDLSWGIPGPVTGMLLADHGARVTKIEPPGGDPSRSFSGCTGLAPGQAQRVPRPEERRRPRPAARARAQTADIIIESYSPGVTAPPRHRLRHARTRSTPASSTCSITGVRPTTASTPTVRATTRWSRPAPASSGRAAASTAAPSPACPASKARCPASSRARRLLDRRPSARARCSPACRGRAWPPCYLATLGDQRRAAGARADRPGPARRRRRCCRACCATTVGGWQKVEHADAPNFQTLGDRPPRAEGRVQVQGRPVDPPLDAAAQRSCSACRKATRSRSPTRSRHRATRRCASASHRRTMVLLHHYNPIMAERFAKFPSDEWIAHRGQGRHAGAADPLARRGAARRAARAGRLCRRGGRPRARAGAPGRPRVPVRRRARRPAGAAGRARRAHRRGAGRGRRCGADAPRRRRRHQRLRPVAARRHPCARPRPGGRRSVRHADARPTSAPTSSRSTRCTTATG